MTTLTDATRMAARARKLTLQLYQQLPQAIKSFVLRQETALVLAGFKAGTDLVLTTPGSTDALEADLESTKQLLQPSGIVLATIHKDIITVAGKPCHRCLVTVYDPQTLERQTQSSKLVLPYTAGMSLESWQAQNSAAGIADEAADGKLYSFPESAISQYLATEGEETYRGEPEHETEKVPLGLFPGDTYLYFGEMAPDSLTREALKRAILENWAQDTEIARLMAEQ